jgi:hypothetical protein
MASIWEMGFVDDAPADGRLADAPASAGRIGRCHGLGAVAYAAALAEPSAGGRGHAGGLFAGETFVENLALGVRPARRSSCFLKYFF